MLLVALMFEKHNENEAIENINKTEVTRWAINNPNQTTDYNRVYLKKQFYFTSL